VCRLAFILVLLAALVAVVIAELARSHDAKRRRREAGLAAELARVLLGRADTSMALADASRRLAAALGLPWAALRLDAAERNAGELAFALG
jgi:hypothetical protein